jgi:transketolase
MTPQKSTKNEQISPSSESLSIKFPSINWNLVPADKSLREEFGRCLVDLGKSFPNLVVVDADLSSSTKTDLFAKAFPTRFFNLGIAEQNMVGVAMGLASSGKIPVVSGFTCFTIARAWDFIRAAAYDELPLKICTTHAGLSPDLDGGSHQALEDLSLIAAIPNSTIFCPADPKEVLGILNTMMQRPGFCYLRLMRNATPWVWATNPPTNADFDDPSKPKLIFESEPGHVDITIISTGSMTSFLPGIFKPLIEAQLSIRAIHLSQIKPLSYEILKPICNATRKLVTLEEHNVIAGFGAQIGRVISEKHPLPILTIGVQDRFGQTGSLSQLYHEYGLDPLSISQQILAWIQK